MIDGSAQLAFIGPGGFEMLVVMLVMLLLFGAKDAPRMFRKLNDILNQLRRTAENFKREVMYGDMEDHGPNHRTVGEYDDYGVNDKAYDGTAETAEAAESSADAENTEPRPDVDEGEDGDAEKA